MQPLPNSPVRWLLIAGAVLTTGMTAGSPARAQTPPRVIEISAERFEFWPSEITIVEGEPVVLRISSDDTLHGFRLVGTGINVAVPKRGKGPVTVSPGVLTPGRYTFECSRLCGAGHNFMRGVLNVRPRQSAEAGTTALQQHARHATRADVRVP